MHLATWTPRRVALCIAALWWQGGDRPERARQRGVSMRPHREDKATSTCQLPMELDGKIYALMKTDHDVGADGAFQALRLPNLQQSKLTGNMDPQAIKSRGTWTCAAWMLR